MINAVGEVNKYFKIPKIVIDLLLLVQVKLQDKQRDVRVDSTLKKFFKKYNNQGKVIAPKKEDKGKGKGKAKQEDNKENDAEVIEKELTILTKKVKVTIGVQSFINEHSNDYQTIVI